MPDKEKVIEAVAEAFDMYESEYGGTSYFDEKEWAENKRDALFLLKEQEAVVRCKDCKNAEILPQFDNAIICKKHSYTGTRPDGFYCADGERKDDDA